MSALAEVFDDVVEADITVIVTGNTVKVRAPTEPPSELLTRLRSAKPDIIAMHHAYIERLHHYRQPHGLQRHHQYLASGLWPRPLQGRLRGLWEASR
jgi:hypothetical protein